MPNNQEKDGSSLLEKYDTKKLAILGIAILVVIITCIAIYNLVFGGANSVEVSSASETEEIKSEIQVHVAGEVIKPGLYKLEDGARV